MERESQSQQQTGTARRILAAARDAFSENGFNGTTVDGIARRAGVNKATLYYQIGDKETLYAKVIGSVIEETVDSIVRDLKQARTPEEKLTTYIRNMADTVDRNPWMPRIMMRELASGGAHFPDAALKSFARIMVVLGEILGEGVRTGVFVETTPVLLHMMVMGAFVFYKASAPIRAREPRLSAKTAKAEGMVSEEIAGEIERLILRALLK